MTKPKPEMLSELPYLVVSQPLVWPFCGNSSGKTYRERLVSYREGDPSGNSCCPAGHLTALRIRPEYTRKLAELHEGDFFGEMS